MSGSKCKLYEMIQKSQNNRIDGYQFDNPVFDYVDYFDKATNTHSIICHSTVVIKNDKWFHNVEQTLVSDTSSNKKLANLNVCEKIYHGLIDLIGKTNVDFAERIPDNDMNASNTIHVSKKLLILIDHENISDSKEHTKLDKFLSTVQVKTTDNDNTDNGIEVIKFASHGSTVKDKTDIVVRSTRKDAVDHYIGYYLGNRIGITPSITDTHSIHVLSRDHFASCLEDFCEAVTHNVDVMDLIKSIQAM
jgi:hypothetical protein